MARTTPLRKIEKMIDFYIVCKSTGLEKFTSANYAQIGPLVETLSSFKDGTREESKKISNDQELIQSDPIRNRLSI